MNRATSCVFRAAHPRRAPGVYAEMWQRQLEADAAGRSTRAVPRTASMRAIGASDPIGAVAADLGPE